MTSISNKMAEYGVTWPRVLAGVGLTAGVLCSYHSWDHISVFAQPYFDRAIGYASQNWGTLAMFAGYQLYQSFPQILKKIKDATKTPNVLNNVPVNKKTAELICAIVDCEEAEKKGSEEIKTREEKLRTMADAREHLLQAIYLPPDQQQEALADARQVLPTTSSTRTLKTGRKEGEKELNEKDWKVLEGIVNQHRLMYGCAVKAQWNKSVAAREVTAQLNEWSIPLEKQKQILANPRLHLS